MRPRVLAGAVLAAAALAVALAACGPYAQLAQKLDVTARIAGDTWIAAAGPDRSVSRILLVARPDADGNARFAFSDLPSGTATATTSTLQGTWTETGSAGAVTLRVDHAYTLPSDNSGARRDDSSRTLRITATRDGSRLVLSGDPAVAGTYVGLADALRTVGTTTARDAACAFQIANLAVMTSEIRIIGFGGNAMFQYERPQTFVGTVAGGVTVSLDVSLTGNHAHTRIEYAAFQDFGSVALAGAQITDTSLGANGQMSGVVRFTLTPASQDPAGAATSIQGSIDYGSNRPDAVQIRDGDPVDGSYAIALDGGGTTLVPVASMLAPSAAVADCLALP